jgi:PIN domain nuclease of toxin-antitoxin system
VRVLLDTQVWLWMLMAPERFSERALDLVQSAHNRLILSAASAWEIAIKYELGRLQLPNPPEAVIPDLMLRSGVEALPMIPVHALRAGSLPTHHRDPFDRMLVAQAQLEGLPILTSDPWIRRYDVEVMEAD